MTLARCPLSMTDILVNPMSKRTSYTIAKCSTDKACKKCGSIGNAVVVIKGPHYTMYCPNCGAYFKHASMEDIKHFYATKVAIEDLTPMKLCMLYIESERTMFNK